MRVFPERMLNHLHACTGLPEQTLERGFEGDYYLAYETGRLSDEEFFRCYKESLPQPNGLTRDDFFDAWLALIGEPTGTMFLARQLAERYPVWLASNTNPSHIRYGETQGYFDGFAGMIYSFEIGVRKPEGEFFQKALDIAGTRAGSSLFVDDKPENVQVALTIGFETLHYRSDPQIKRDLDLWVSSQKIS